MTATQSLPATMHKQALAELDRVLTQWLTSDFAADDLPVALQRGIVGVLEEFSNGEVPEEFLDFTLSVDFLRELWNDFQAAMNSAEFGKVTKPTSEFLSAVRHVQSHYHTSLQPEPRKLPDLTTEFRKTIALEGVNDVQICKTFGFTHDNTRTGIPDLLVLEAAKKDPEKFFHQDHPEWRWPSERAQEINAEKRQADFLALQPLWQARIDELEKQQAAPAPAERKTIRPTESIETLLAMKGMRGDQICQMKKISHEQLELYCIEHGLAYPGQGYLS